MKFTISLALLCLILLQSGCSLGPTIDQQSHTDTQSQQTLKRSDAFARDLQQ
ncbi:MAG TPA: hypothetical protein VGQ40_08715 [Chthoniobacterales bacterium]|jgi:hypothetical protein|nr:hypothetical protein [Chthoniobacterales bacterium]